MIDPVHRMSCVLRFSPIYRSAFICRGWMKGFDRAVYVVGRCHFNKPRLVSYSSQHRSVTALSGGRTREQNTARKRWQCHGLAELMSVSHKWTEWANAVESIWYWFQWGFPGRKSACVPSPKPKTLPSVTACTFSISLDELSLVQPSPRQKQDLHCFIVVLHHIIYVQLWWSGNNILQAVIKLCFCFSVYHSYWSSVLNWT